MEEKQKIKIYSPCYEGSRFEEHRFPLDLIDDLLMLRNMTIEMAKAIYLEKNQNRKRVPRNFTNGISIELESIESGSTIPNLVLIAAMSGLFPQENTSYFTEAEIRITNVIEAAHLNKPIQDLVPINVLNYFNMLGSNLKEDERIIFGDKENSKVILDRESRKRLVLAASKAKEYNAPFELRGIITALDKERKIFEIQNASGVKIKGEYTQENLDVLQTALVEMETKKKVLLTGIATFNSSDKLLKINSLEDAISLEPLDVPARLEELTLLQKGWLNGDEGEPLDINATKWLSKTFDLYFDSENLPLPATFPTPDANVQFEWSINKNEISLFFDLKSKIAEFYALNTQSQEEKSVKIDFSNNESWAKLNTLIREING